MSGRLGSRLLEGIAVTLLAVAVVPAVPVTPVAAQSPAGKKVLDPADLSYWKTIRAPQVSNDGKWFAYQLAPNEGDGETIVRPTGEGAEWRFPVGEPTALIGGQFDPTLFGAASPLAFSADSKWLLFTKYPTAAEAKKAKKDRKPAQNSVVLVNLANGEKKEYEKVRRFAFAGDHPNWVVLHRYGDTPAAPAGPAAPGAAPSPPPVAGADLLLVDLRNGAVTNIGNVGEFALDDSGEWLSWTIETKDQVGNGVVARNLRTDVVRTLESDKRLYRRLTWADSGLALAVLRGKADSASSDTSYSVVGFNNFGAPTGVATVVFSPADAGGASFPTGMRVSPDRAPKWSTDFSTIFFGLTARRESPESKTGRPDVKPVAGTPGAMQSPAGAGMPDDDLPSLVIWHVKDPRLQSQQQVEEQRDKTYSYLAEYRIPEKKFVRLATDEMREVTLTPREKFAIGSDRRAYEQRDNIDGGQRRDVYAIDLTSGQSAKILSAQRWPTQPSPDGTKVLYYDDGQYRVYDLTAKTTRSISTGLPTSFVDTEDDHNVDRPPTAALGWTSDGSAVLLSDNWDVWKVPAGPTGTAVNLTGNGRTERLRYQRRISYNSKEKGVDFSKPVYFSVYGEKTKKEGLVRLNPGKPMERLLWDDAKYFVRRARDTETFVYTKETFLDFPDYYVSEHGFATPKRLTDANPQQKDYAWSSGARLIDYVSDKGDSLQGALYLPADYQPGKKYPMVVYIYEKLSQQLHTYATPNETRAFNPSVFTSRGYAVLQPDIVYKINDPGMSAVWCVVPAVKAAIATGIVDPANVGLHGHSWGGYQSAFLATQTGTLFKSVISGAPLTDMISMYNSVYWNTGTADMAIFESSQGRFKGSYLDNMDAYVRNSPAFHVKDVKTSIMLLHNEKDGAVDFNQGITFYNSLREQEKDVILLQYVGENHGLAQPKNQKDYTIRMREYFDHYLQGAPAPDWMKEGIPRLKMEEHLKSRQKKEKIAS
ncbi:MAG: prolyl oligopeptidase family serine peptidase [Gemmatimonadaceae bacterium]